MSGDTGGDAGGDAGGGGKLNRGGDVEGNVIPESPVERSSQLGLRWKLWSTE